MASSMVLGMVFWGVVKLYLQWRNGEAMIKNRNRRREDRRGVS